MSIPDFPLFMSDLKVASRTADFTYLISVSENCEIGWMIY